MSAAVQEIKSFKNNIKTPKRYTWEEFRNRFLKREDNFKYEWVNGFVVKTPRSMDKNQLYIIDNLLELFDEIKLNHLIDGRLTNEIDTFFANNHRRPDMAYFTKAQIRAAKDNENVVPQFVIEVISTNDQMNRVHEKMDDYRNAQVSIIWHILPLRKEVHVYQNGINMRVCKGDDICSAEPVLPHFALSVNDIFK